jgi:hypothetical protein
MNKKSLVICIIGVCVWLNTYYVSIHFVRTHEWYLVEGSNRLLLLSMIAFDSSIYECSPSLASNGAIYGRKPKKSSICNYGNTDAYLGEIVKKYHNYRYAYIVVKDLNQDTALYKTESFLQKMIKSFE